MATEEEFFLSFRPRGEIPPPLPDAPTTLSDDNLFKLIAINSQLRDGQKLAFVTGTI